MDLGLLAAQLSSEFPSPATRSAAARFLSLSDPSAALGKIYRFLVWHHTLRTALGHLEAEGADLAALEIPVQTYQETFRGHGQAVWNLDVGLRITARDLVKIYALHRRLLTETIEQVSDAGVDRFTLISGRAYHARYPHYEHRVEFDSDIVVPDISAALQVMRALEPRGYRLERLSVQQFGDSPSAKLMLQRAESGHLVSLDVLVGGYHAHRGLIYERSDPVASEAGVFRVARPEDMLVMLAARIERKGTFTFFNFNDAAVILDTEGSQLSWDLVCDTAAAAGLSVTLAVLLRRAEVVLGRSEVPAEARERLESGLTAGIRRKLTEKVADAKLTFGVHGRGGSSEIAMRSWRIAVHTRQQLRADTPSITSRAILTAQRRILLKQLRVIRSGRDQTRVDQAMAYARTRSGVLCEVSTRLAASHGCIATQSSWHGSTSARSLLTDLAAQLEPRTSDHLCSRLQFHLWSGEGT